MFPVYMIFAATHMVVVAITGILWTLVILGYLERLKPSIRLVRVAHFGSLYLAPWFLGLAYAFDKLKVPDSYQSAFPASLGLLFTLAGIAYFFRRPPEVTPFYYWTQGAPLILVGLGLIGLALALCWSAALLVIYSLG